MSVPASVIVHRGGIQRGGQEQPLPPAITAEPCTACDGSIYNAPEEGPHLSATRSYDVCSWRCALVLFERELVSLNQALDEALWPVAP